MTDPNLENCDDQIDRYVRGGLTPAEARELAQESLDDAELFEVLTYSALAKKAVAAGSNGRRVIRLWRPGRFIIAGSIAAAIAVYASLDALREAPSPAGRSTVHPTPDPARDDRQPILLANDLPAGPEEPPEIFRGAEPQSRLPRSSGTILAIDGGVAAIDIGAADGLTEGIELEVFRSGNAAPPVGYVQVTTVFRERARGSIEGGIRARDQVRIPAAVHLTARMERVHTLAAWGDLGTARAAAEDAVQWAASADAPAEGQAAAWNTLAVLRLLQADRAGGEALLQRALAACPHANALCPQILNNLGVVAELTGDEGKARQQYGRAMRARTGHPSQAQETVIESNFARVAR